MNDIIEKFPDVLKSALKTNKVSFSGIGNILCDFERIPRAIRVITREQDNNSPICEKDFLSHIERYRLGERIKGVSEETEKDIGYYSCSFYEEKSKDKLIRIMKLPKKRKRMIVGYIVKNNGIICTNEDGHIHLWLYKDSKIHEQFSYVNSED